MLDKHLTVKTEPEAFTGNMTRWKSLRVSVLSPTLFRIEKDINKKFCDKATQAVWFRNMSSVEYSVEFGTREITLTTDKATLVVKEEILNSYVILGDKTVFLGKIKNLPGAYRSLDRCDGNVYLGRDGVNKRIKLEDGIVSADGVGLYDDTKSLILEDDGRLAPREDDQADIYVFAHGKDFRGALRDLYMISGSVPLIPRYALGNWWSRYHAYTDKEYLLLLDKFARRDVPLTVATVDMDWHWSNTLDEKKKITEQGKNDEYHGGNNGWTGYSWNTDLFPDYREFLGKVKQRDLKITLNLHPADGIRYFEDMYADMARAVGKSPETEQLIPFDFTSDDFINAYFKILHKPYERDGVDFWWIDWQQGEQTSMPGLDPLWALNHYHTLDNATDHESLILSRYCGIGSHRYPLGFSGDTVVSWNSLNFIPYFTAMGTNAGYTWWSHDIGGHMNGEKNDELYMRYVQFGVFSPINRLHCVSSRLVTKEPSVYMNGTGLIAEEFLRLRHKMIPFLYSASYETHVNGRALIEPMYYAYPDSKDAYGCDGQYTFGDQLIVAPITHASEKKGLTVKSVWLPEGRWTDIFTGDEYDGGRWVDMVRWKDSIPVLAKEGGFFVLDGRQHTNSIANPDKLTVCVFNGNGEYTLHEDSDGSFMHTHFKSEAVDGVQRVTISVDGDRSVMSNRDYRLEFRNIPDGKIRICENGKEIDFETEVDDYITVIIQNVSSFSCYTVEVEFNINQKEYRLSRTLYAIRRIECSHEQKLRLFRGMRDGYYEETKSFIDNERYLTKAEKLRLLEAW